MTTTNTLHKEPVDGQKACSGGGDVAASVLAIFLAGCVLIVATGLVVTSLKTLYEDYLITKT